jgi:hypothetical protein
MIVLAIAAAATAAFLAWVFLSHLVINHGLVVGPWIRGRTCSKGYWWPWLGRKGKGWSISLKPDGELHGVLDYSARIPATATKLVWHYRAEITQAMPSEAPSSAPLVSLVLQRKGDDWSGKGGKGDYRLYSPAFPLETGEHTRMIPLQGWSNVWGQPADMAVVIRNLSNIAVAFGHAGGRMHGISGVGSFTLVSLEAA